MNIVRIRIGALLLLICAIGIGFFVSNIGGKFPYRLGLDLNGGTHLSYQADTSEVPAQEIPQAMNSLQEVIERRVNVFGVSEPLVQIESGGGNQRLIVELPGVTDVEEAVKSIGKTPLLEFRTARLDVATATISAIAQLRSENKEVPTELWNQAYQSTGLTGSLLSRSQVEFNQTTRQPLITIHFNDEGKDLLAKVTQENLGNVMAIFLDGFPISEPVIRDEIKDGIAQISGNFTAPEARQLSRDLNFGALSVPITLIETQSIGPSLGIDTLKKALYATAWGIIAIALFLVVWYRLPGVVASVALIVYAVIMMALFKLVPVTLTAAGLAGFILSLGMAVDANVLIFERIREEIKKGKAIREAIVEGSSRAWPSIRDGNVSSIISALVLYWFSGTALIKGFALVFFLGVLISMFTAIVVSRTLLLALSPLTIGKKGEFLFGNGIRS